MSLTGTVHPVGYTADSSSPTPPEDFNAVLYVQQNLSQSQKLQALTNISAISQTDIDTLLSDVEFDPNTRIITFSRENEVQFSFDLSNNDGVEDISLDANNDIIVAYQDGTNSVIYLSNLLNNFIQKVNGKTGIEIIIDIDDIDELREELDYRVPTVRTIAVDDEEYSLENSIQFTTNAVKYVPQNLSQNQQETIHDNINVYSKEEVDDLIQASQAPKQKAIHVHTLTPADVAQATITLHLADVPDVSEFYDLHINGVYVNDDDYIVNQNQVIIAKSNIAYEVQAGMKLTFRYRYV